MQLFVPLLTVLFIGLKLTGHITWSWLWVLSPLWIGFALVVTALILTVIVSYIADKTSSTKRK